MAYYAKLDNYLETHLDESIAELSRLVAQPSVGAQNLGMQECAALVAEMLKKRGFTTEVMPTPGAPVVYGETQKATGRCCSTAITMSSLPNRWNCGKLPHSSLRSAKANSTVAA
jgi:acetylornithine deacetylase/succinyl-diaminopimelate desuccinylase-like protein